MYKLCFVKKNKVAYFTWADSKPEIEVDEVEYIYRRKGVIDWSLECQKIENLFRVLSRENISCLN